MHSECVSIGVAEGPKDQELVIGSFCGPFLPGDTGAPAALPIVGDAGSVWSAVGRGRKPKTFSCVSPPPSPSFFLILLQRVGIPSREPTPTMKKTEGHLFLKKGRCRLVFCGLRYKC